MEDVNMDTRSLPMNTNVNYSSVFLQLCLYMYIHVYMCDFHAYSKSIHAGYTTYTLRQILQVYV